MPDRKDENDRTAEEQKREKGEQNQEKVEQNQENAEQADKVDHHIPAPPKKKKHRKKHWEQLPGSKRKPFRSFKSPGRK